VPARVDPADPVLLQELQGLPTHGDILDLVKTKLGHLGDASL